MKNLERRFFDTATLDVDRLTVVRAEGDGPKITGYAARFNSWSEDLGGFRERLKPGAFTEALRTSDVRALWNHNPDHVLGRTKSGTLELEENGTGLKMTVRPPDTQMARDLMASIERGDVTQQSFAFTVAEGGDTWTESAGAVERTITKVDRLFDVSPVTYPAYPDTSVALRSLEAFRNSTHPTPKPEGDGEPTDGKPTLGLNLLAVREREMEINIKEVTNGQD